MSLDLSLLSIFTVAYLFLLFGAAWLTDRGYISRKITSHPLVYVLSLGVYTSAWAFYGVVGIAHNYGYVFLAYYLGVCGTFLLAPVLLMPLLRITRDNQLSSLADLFAFRFRSSMAGTLTTILMLLAMVPLVTMQIQAVSDSVHILTSEGSPDTLAFGFCVLIILFTMAFGTRNISSREKHHGIVFAIAIESVIKLAALLTLGGFILFQVFDGPTDLQNWLTTHQDALNTLHIHLDDGPWRTMLLMFFAAAIVMPDMFHMVFTENQKSHNLSVASWGLPLYLLLMSLPVPLIIWGGLSLGTTASPEYFALGISQVMNSPWLSVLIYIGSMSAASGLIIVTTLALSSMVINHLILPVYQPPTSVNIYRWLSWTKRLLIAAMILTSYGFFLILHAEQELVSLAVVAFVAGLQFLPGVLSTIYWPHATRSGFCSGLVGGTLVWMVTMLLPMILPGTEFHLLGLEISQANNDWHLSALVSLSVNTLLLVIVSLSFEPSSEERRAAESCSIQTLARPRRSTLKAGSPEEFQINLTRPLGSYTAQREVSQALHDLGFSMEERRPYALRRLRDRIEANISGLMGPSVARDIINRYLPYKQDETSIADLNFVESQIEEYQHRLTGLAGELDTLRRYHRQTLQNLPMAICSLGSDGEILMWNKAMAAITGIPGCATVGSQLVSVAQPWHDLLNDFAQNISKTQERRQLLINGKLRWLNFHKDTVTADNGLVIMLEDQTETQMLEQKLIHSERLASIGQLAAGVAHEIGNPVTGVDCLAQELRSVSQDEDTREIAGQILEQTQRIGRILHSLVSFAHTGQASEQMGSEPVNLYACANEAISLLLLNRDNKDIRFLNHINEGHVVTADNQKMTQVFINLLNNARDASPDFSNVVLSSHASEHTIVLNVADQGCGIPEQHHKRLFEPFFTTKEAGKGTGLGLALVYSIIEEHFGTITVNSPVDKETKTGTCISISLPRYVAELDDLATREEAENAI